LTLAACRVVNPARARLRSALARLEAAPGPSLDGRNKPGVAERPADRLGGAQAREQFVVVTVEQGGEIRKARAGITVTVH